MPDNHVFEYAIVRVVPRVEREEFINVGVILYCKSRHFLQVISSMDEQRLLSLYSKLDLEDIRCHLHVFELISSGHPNGGPIAALDIASRFRWLTAKRSTVLQTSGVHPGLCEDPLQTLKKLHEQLVS